MMVWIHCWCTNGSYVLGQSGTAVAKQSCKMIAQRRHLWVAISTVPDPSGSGRVDMLTSPVAAARAVVATGAWVKSKHDKCLIRASVGAWALFSPIRRRIKKKRKKTTTQSFTINTALRTCGWYTYGTGCYIYTSTDTSIAVEYQFITRHSHRSSAWHGILHRTAVHNY